MKNKWPNPKHALFVREYLIDRNATRAAIAAGYSEKGARVTGARLLANPNIRAKIDEVLAKVCNRLEISVENVAKELARLAFLDPRKFYNENGGLKHISELDDDTAACLAGMEVEDLFEGQGDERMQTGFLRKIKFADKGANLERLGRYLKMFTDKLDLSGSIATIKPDLSRLTDEQLRQVRDLVETAHTRRD